MPEAEGTSQTSRSELLLVLPRWHPGDGSNYDTGCDQCVLADHVRRHSNVIARDQAHQQRSRCGSRHAENQVNGLIHALTMTQPTSKFFLAGAIASATRDAGRGVQSTSMREASQ